MTQTNGQDAPRPPAPSPSRNVQFTFEAKVFQAPGACFLLSGHPKEPVFAVDMGGNQAIITLKHLRKTFDIAPNTPDDAMIDRAAAGLRHVPDIRPGDDIPSEILDGTASWTVSRRHKTIARERIQVQLLSWMSGKPLAAVTSEGLKAILEKEENRKALRDAFGRAAEALGLPPDQTDTVIDHIETLARELCYIEALREHATAINKIHDLMDPLSAAYAGDIKTTGDLRRVKSLLAQGIEEVEKLFEDVDAETADVLSALMSIPKLIATIRRTRDDVHFLMMEWDSVLAKWKGLQPAQSAQVDRALAATYKFLVQRFPTGKSVVRRKIDANAVVEPPKSLLTTDDKPPPPPEPPKSLLSDRKSSDPPDPGRSILPDEKKSAAPPEPPRSLLPEDRKAKSAAPPEPPRSLLLDDKKSTAPPEPPKSLLKGRKKEAAPPEPPRSLLSAERKAQIRPKANKDG